MGTAPISAVHDFQLDNTSLGRALSTALKTAEGRMTLLKSVVEEVRRRREGPPIQARSCWERLLVNADVDDPSGIVLDVGAPHAVGS